MALEKLKETPNKIKKENKTMSTNYYMLEQVAKGINSDRRQDANAYRLWRKALRLGRQRAGANGR